MLMVSPPKVLVPSRNLVRKIHGRCRIGTRDVVGHGANGTYSYKDDAHFPFPAIRFKQNSKNIRALREKERGDWKLLCFEEKKALYRASFCCTFSEFQANTGTWKFVLGCVFITTSFAFWTIMFFHHYVNEPLPPSFSQMSQKHQLRRMIELHVNPIDGLTSHWDYEQDMWKYLVEKFRGTKK